MSVISQGFNIVSLLGTLREEIAAQQIENIDTLSHFKVRLAYALERHLPENEQWKTPHDLLSIRKDLKAQEIDPEALGISKDDLNSLIQDSGRHYAGVLFEKSKGYKDLESYKRVDLSYDEASQHIEYINKAKKVLQLCDLTFEDTPIQQADVDARMRELVDLSISEILMACEISKTGVVSSYLDIKELLEGAGMSFEDVSLTLETYENNVMQFFKDNLVPRLTKDREITLEDKAGHPNSSVEDTANYWTNNLAKANLTLEQFGFNADDLAFLQKKNIIGNIRALMYDFMDGNNKRDRLFSALSHDGWNFFDTGNYHIARQSMQRWGINARDAFSETEIALIRSREAKEVSLRFQSLAAQSPMP